jgi:hypothetical protein
MNMAETGFGRADAVKAVLRTTAAESTIFVLVDCGADLVR